MKNKMSKLAKTGIVLGILLIGGFIFFKSTSGIIDYSSILFNFFTDSTDYKEELAVEKEEIMQEQKTEETEDNLDFDKSYIINLLFLGIDRTIERDTGKDGIYRTDTLSLIRIDLNTKRIKVLSIPRDTYTFIPIENKKDKINHAYAYGLINDKGIEASIEAVDSLLKYGTVDYYFALDIKPIPEIVDAVGGIEIDVEMDMKNWETNLSKGLQVLDGEKAYQYIHWRYSSGGDIDRIKRQQKFIKALYQKLKESNQLVEIAKIVLSYKENVKTDLSIKQILGLAKLSGELSEDNISYYMIPGAPKTIDGISYWVPDETESDKILKNFFSSE